MAKDVDELFGAGGREVRPRTVPILVTLGCGLVVAVLGLACTSVPGGLMVLVSWMLIEKEMSRIESGYLPVKYEGNLRSLRIAVWAGMILILIIFFLQAYLLCTGTYVTVWSALLDGLRFLLLPATPIQS